MTEKNNDFKDKKARFVVAVYYAVGEQLSIE